MNDIRHLQETPADSAVADAGKETLLELKGISKSFGTTDVLKDIDLSIERGEFITFLGASGCGKPQLCVSLPGWKCRTKAR